MKDQAARINALLAKQEITDVLMRYARGVDRADGDLLNSCYHPDATEEHGGNYAGPASDYIAGAIGRLQTMGPMAHYLCNIHIELEGDTAYVESYVITFARFARDAEEFDTFTGGRLCDRFELRDNKWLIAHRKIVFDWNRDAPKNEGWCLGMFDTGNPGMLMGRKDRDDLSYQRF